MQSMRDTTCMSLETLLKQARICDIALRLVVIKWQLDRVFPAWNAHAVIHFVSVAVRSLILRVRVRNWLNGWPNVRMKVKQLIGYLPTLRNVLTATLGSRRIKDVIIWIVVNVSLNFVGYVWVNGLIMVKGPVDIISVIVMIRANQLKAKPRHKRPREN